MQVCEQTHDGRFQLQIVASRPFKILEAGRVWSACPKPRKKTVLMTNPRSTKSASFASEASLHESGYLLATVRFPTTEKAKNGQIRSARKRRLDQECEMINVPLKPCLKKPLGVRINSDMGARHCSVSWGQCDRCPPPKRLAGPASLGQVLGLRLE